MYTFSACVLFRLQTFATFVSLLVALPFATRLRPLKRLLNVTLANLPLTVMLGLLLPRLLLLHHPFLSASHHLYAYVIALFTAIVLPCPRGFVALVAIPGTMTEAGVSPAFSTSLGARTRRTEGGGERSWGSGKRPVVSGRQQPAKATTMTMTMLRARYVCFFHQSARKGKLESGCM